MRERKIVHFGIDTGEAEPGPGREQEMDLLCHVTAVSIACGGHAGDASSMRGAIESAQANNCMIGVHPSYPDRSGFGRRALKLERAQLEAAVIDQLSIFSEIAQVCGAPVSYVKAHGALYHTLACDMALARHYWAWCASIFPDASFVGPQGSGVLDELKELGVRVLAEGFCDRAYKSDGSLRPRTHCDALISDPQAAADQAQRLAFDMGCDLLCVHSDTPNALLIAQAVNTRLRELGVHPDR